MSIDQLMRTAIHHLNAGQLAQAEGLLRQVVRQQPNLADALHGLALVCVQTGRVAEAARWVQQAITANSHRPLYHAHLGEMLRLLGRPHEAVRACQRALTLDSRLAEAWFTLGTAQRELGQSKDAIEAFSRAIGIEPQMAEAHNNLGTLLHDSGRTTEAIVHLQQAVAIHPAYAEAHTNLGNAFLELGQLDQVEQCHRKALALEPQLARAHNNLGMALLCQDKVADAIACFRCAVNVAPQLAEAHNNLANALRRVGKHAEAVQHYQRALQIQPRMAETWSNLGTALGDLSRLDEAIACYRKAIEIRPDYADAHSNLVYRLNHHPDLSPEEVHEEHLAWARQHAEPLHRHIKPHSNSLNADRRLRVGYVSPYFRQHAVSCFVEPMLAHHDHQQFEIFCYSDAVEADATTQRLRSCADVWRDTAVLSDTQLADRIRADEIDILVDLTGHIGGQRLRCFAQKPAPVQVTYLGYQNTTGLSTMDYRITDALADPPGQTEQWHTERLWHLECFFCYQPRECPAIGPLPAARNGYITFGSLNQPVKLNENVARVWAEILQQVPQSRLILLSMDERGDDLKARVQKHGVALERIRCVSLKPRAEYLEVYNELDIALDPFPFSGHTTTCDALWMGVPVVTLAGRTYAGRMSLSVLHHLGAPEWIAQTEREYANIAISLAGDVQALAHARHGLRRRMCHSRVTSGSAFVVDLENAFRRMWDRYLNAGTSASRA